MKCSAVASYIGMLFNVNSIGSVAFFILDNKIFKETFVKKNADFLSD
jgi:hypothetical protein